jgi:hypothetical protein
MPAHIVLPPERAKSGAVRAFVDRAAPALKRELLRIETMIAVPKADSGSTRPRK